MKILQGNYLIAGSTGLMGTTSVLKLKDIPGVNVRAIYHNRRPKIFGDNISYVHADLRNIDECKKVVKNIDYVLMFAAILSTSPIIARDPISHISSNLIMNINMLEESYKEGVKKFLWLSSSTGYSLDNINNEGLKEEDMLNGDPSDPYFYVGWMSRYTEVLCRMFSTKLENPMTTIIFRPTSIYGEYQDFHFERSHVLPALIRKIIEKQNPIEIFGDGNTEKDLIYAGDVFDACIVAIEKINKFDIFNISSGKQYSINKLLKMIMEIENYYPEIEYNTTKSFSTKRINLDVSKIKKILGFEAKISIQDGISRMISWYKQDPIKY